MHDSRDPDDGLELVRRRLSELREAEHNSRTHSPQQVEEIAASMRQFGITQPILVDESDEIIAGHGRRAAALLLGKEWYPCIVLRGLTPEQKRAYLIADNQLPQNAGWNFGMLRAEVERLQAVDFDIGVLGFDSAFLDKLLADALPPPPAPAPPADDGAAPVSVLGDLWYMGGHRVMCGDSESPTAVQALVGDERAALLHADPPYGMGKQSEGVQNDNLYRAKLDRFQLSWWNTWRPYLADKASAYIWGNAGDLWRLWYAAGLGASEELTACNEIVWDKGSVSGMKWADAVRYQTASERALFFQLGRQFVGNINSDQYWEGWEPLRGYLAAEAEAVGLTPKRTRQITGVQMFSHWFTRSQWSMVGPEHYAALAAEYPGHFSRPYPELRAEYDRIREKYRVYVNGAQEGGRSYFDNTHDAMTDVWQFPRVTGSERHGHATPKPVEMMERVMRSSLPRGGLCVEPFGGTGSTLMGAERTGRRCYTMELTPKYVDVIVRRWQQATGGVAVHAETGRLFNDCATRPAA